MRKCFTTSARCAEQRGGRVGRTGHRLLSVISERSGFRVRFPGGARKKKQRATHATNDRHALYNLICYLSTIYYYLSTIYLIQSTTTGTEIPYPCSTEEVRRKNAVARPLDCPGLQERWLSPYKPEVVGSKPTGGIHTSAALQKRLVIA